MSNCPEHVMVEVGTDVSRRDPDSLEYSTSHDHNFSLIQCAVMDDYAFRVMTNSFEYSHTVLRRYELMDVIRLLEYLEIDKKILHDYRVAPTGSRYVIGRITAINWLQQIITHPQCHTTARWTTADQEEDFISHFKLYHEGSRSEAKLFASLWLAIRYKSDIRMFFIGDVNESPV